MSTFNAEKLSLHYWPGRGLMEPVRDMLAIAGKTAPTDFTDGRHSEPTGDMKCNLGRMPTIETASGSIGQSASMFYYVAATHDLIGTGPFEAAKCLEMQEHINEVKRAWYAMVPYGTEPTAEQLDTWFDGGASDTEGPAQGRGERHLTWWLGRINAGITGTDGFAVGSKLSMADVLLYNLLAEHLEENESDMPENKRYPFNSKERSEKAIAAFPKIASSIAKVAENAGMQKWLATRGPQGF